MNGLDTAILVVIGLSAVLGAIRGMLTEVLSLLVWVLALWLTVAFGDVVAAEFTGIPTPLLRSLAGYGATFVLVVVLGNLVVWLLRTLLHGAGLSGTDRLLGFGFGAARGYAIVLAVVLLVSFTPWSRAPLWRGSTLMPAFSTPAGWIAAQLPSTSELLGYARPALDALPALTAPAEAALAGEGAVDAATAPAGLPALPGIDLGALEGLDLQQAAQWAGFAAPAPATVPPREVPAPDPARVGASTSPGGDPAAVQPRPESP